MKVQRLTETAKLPKKYFKSDAGYDIFVDEQVKLLPLEPYGIVTGKQPPK